MAEEPAAKEHYSDRYKREIDALKAEIASLRVTEGVVLPKSSDMPDATMFAAFFTAAHEAGGRSREDLEDLLMERWHRVRNFLRRVREGEDVALYEKHVAAVNAAREAAELQLRLDKEGEERKQRARREAMNVRAT